MSTLFDGLVISFVGAVVCFASALGYGRFWKKHDWDLRLLLGLGIQGFISFWCAFAGCWNLPVMTLILMVGLVLLYIDRKVVEFPSMKESSWWILCGIGLLSLVDACAPVTDTDALYYHLALAKQMFFQGSLVGGWFEPNGSRPMLLHLHYSLAYGTFGTQAPILLYWLLSMSLLVSVIHRSKSGAWGAILLVSSWSFFQELGVLANNLPTAFALFLTWRMVCEQRYWIAMFLAFVTLSFKLTALGAIAAIWLIYIPNWRIRMRVAAGVVVLSLIWPLRNIWEGLPPLFPYMGWDEPFQHVEKYGMGREWIDFLMLPYNIFVYAKPDSHIFQGQLSPMLAFAGLALFRAKRKDIFFLLCCFSFWAVGPQWLRHLMLILPLYIYIVAPHLRELPFKGLLTAGFLLGLISNWGTLMIRWGEKSKVLAGEITVEAYQKENIVGYEALRWVDEKIPESSCPALVYVWSGAILNRPYILSSVEDHIPIRSWITRHKEESLNVLSCDYLVVGSPAVHRKKYAFLSEDAYKKAFLEPIAYLEELLLQQGHLIYTQNGVRVYRIEKDLDKI